MALMMGAAPCGPCHQDVAQSYQQTAHFLTSSSANSTTIHGSFLEGRNVLQTAVPGVYFRMERKGEAFYQTAVDHGRTHSERFDLVLGSGRRGQSYLYWKSGLLYQLPVSFLRPHRGMDEQSRLSGWRSALRSCNPNAVPRVPRDRGRQGGPVRGRDHLPEMSWTRGATSRYTQSGTS